MYTLKYLSNGIISDLETDGLDTMLDVLIKNKVKDVNFMCRDGYCGYCKCIKTSGDIEYKEEPMVVLRDNEFLPCISKPKSNIEFRNILDVKKPD